MKLDIVTSALNEEKCIPELYKRICLVMEKEFGITWRLIICDNGSRDTTWKCITQIAEADKRVVGVKLSRTFRLDSAFTCGMDLSNSDAVIIMASDLQDPPESIPELLRSFEEGFEQVLVRITQRKSVPIVRRILSHMFYKIAGKLTDDMIPRNVSDFRLVSKNVVHEMIRLRESNRFLRGLFAWGGFRTAYIEIERPQRFGGESAFLNTKLSKIVNWAFTSLLAFTTKPLTWIAIIGVLSSLISGLGTALFAGFWILGHGVPFAGFGTIVGLITLGFSLVLLCMGVMAQYMALIYEEVKQRPLYLISQTINLD